MAQRKWEYGYSMGYAGTDSKETIDLVTDWGYSEKEVEEMTDDEAQEIVTKSAYESAVEKIDYWAKKALPPTTGE